MPSEMIACPVCESAQFAVLTRTDRYRMGVVTCQCQGCGLVMTNPMPSEAALGKFYRDDYRIYYRKVDKPSEVHARQYGLTERAQYTAGFLKGAGLLAGNPRTLDVGCAEGSLLRAIGALEPGTTRVGIEPNPHFREFARTWAGAKVYTSLDDVQRAGDLKFSLILVNHVLEHIRDPGGFLTYLTQLLLPNGAIYVDVPDATRYVSIDDLHLAHLYHFSPTSFSNLARKSGLTAQRIDQHEPPHHPISIRSVLIPGTAAIAPDPDPDRDVVRRRVEKVAAMAPLYFLRRSLLGKVVVGLPLKIWNALRAPAPGRG